MQAGLDRHRPFSSPLHQTLCSQFSSKRNLILIDDALNCSFLNRQAPAITLLAQLGYTLQWIDSCTPALDWTKPAATADRHATLLQLFIRGNPFRNSASQIQVAQQWLQFLLDAQQLSALVVYGSPYVMQQSQPQLPADLPMYSRMVKFLRRKQSL